ncbi:MAG TPA: aminotransferase class IV [Pseudomonadota bacterium]|nr:aminotransferase class IV [Pseudomonadota bacterium]
MSETPVTDTWIWIDGAVWPAAEARVPVLDRGFLYGDSVFEVTRTAGRRPIFFAQHLLRLAQSAELLAMHLPPPKLLVAACREVIARVADEAYLRIIVTRGSGAMDLDPASADEPRLVVLARPLRLPDAALYQTGVALVSVTPSDCGVRMLPAAKSSNYLPSVMALGLAKKRGAYEALLCDGEDAVTEGASSNFFIVRGDEIWTPPLSLGLLSGITRAAVLRLATDLGLTCREARFTVTEAEAADEAFLTSSVRGLLPVTRLNDRPIGDGQVGECTQRLLSAYAACLARGGDWSER